MKKPLDILLNTYGCNNTEELKNYLGDVSIVMLTEAIEMAQNEAWNKAIKEASKANKKYNFTFANEAMIRKSDILKLIKKY